jgi:hypothetical protein
VAIPNELGQPDPSQQEEVVNQKGELEEEQEGGMGPDENTGTVGPSDLSYSFTTVGHIMVDHEVTPTCLLPYMTPALPIIPTQTEF